MVAAAEGGDRVEIAGHGHGEGHLLHRIGEAVEQRHGDELLAIFIHRDYGVDGVADGAGEQAHLAVQVAQVHAGDAAGLLQGGGGAVQGDGIDVLAQREAKPLGGVIQTDIRFDGHSAGTVFVDHSGGADGCGSVGGMSRNGEQKDAQDQRDKAAHGITSCKNCMIIYYTTVSVQMQQRKP